MGTETAENILVRYCIIDVRWNKKGPFISLVLFYIFHFLLGGNKLLFFIKILNPQEKHRVLFDLCASDGVYVAPEDDQL